MKTRLALLLPFLALAGCADNNASVRIAAICSPPADPTVCTFSATCDAQYIGANTLDVGVTNRLWVFVQVDNQTPKNDNAGIGRTNTNDAWVQEYEVEYTGAPLPVATGSIPGSAHVPAGGSAVISVFPISESIGAGLAALVPAGGSIDIVAKIRLRGVYGDTTEFETGVFEVPVHVCSGCVPVLTCTAPDYAAYCPPMSAGQLPAGAQCVTP